MSSGEAGGSGDDDGLELLKGGEVLDPEHLLCERQDELLGAAAGLGFVVVGGAAGDAEEALGALAHSGSGGEKAHPARSPSSPSSSSGPS